MQLNTYLNYGGNCEQAFRFYEQHLGGKITMLMRTANSRTQQGAAGWEAVLHARMNIGGTNPRRRRAGRAFQPMRSAYLSLSVDSTEEAERIYTLLTEAARSS